MSTDDLDMRRRDREHPTDLLPDFLHGALGPEQKREVAAHVDDCPVCAEELDVLSLLAEQPAPGMTREERDRIYDRIDFGGRASPEPAGASGWWSAAWKVAATIALLATGVGVWQIYLAGSSGAGWSATAALEAWEEDVREVDLSSEDARVLLAFFEPDGRLADGGPGTDVQLDRVVDDVLDGFDPGVLDGIAEPWEEQQ
jgi:anti-sigma factor RsiW